MGTWISCAPAITPSLLQDGCEETVTWGIVMRYSRDVAEWEMVPTKEN